MVDFGYCHVPFYLFTTHTHTHRRQSVERGTPLPTLLIPALTSLPLPTRCKGNAKQGQ